MQKQVDGVLLVPALSTEGPVAFLRSRGVPVVVLDRRVPECSADVVRGDSEQGGYELTKLLLDLGHRRIAILSGPPEVSTAADRVAGYRRALAEAGLDCDPALILHGRLRQEGGYQMTQQALALASRPTALFAANNFIAIGAYRALGAAGLRVPDDMAMVAFDDLPAALILEPFLTVAAQPAYEMGQIATELLLARLSGQAPGGSARRSCCPSRSSCAGRAANHSKANSLRRLAIMNETAATSEQEASQRFADANLRWNFTVNSLDVAFFLLGLSIISQTTIMPLLVRQLTDSTLAIGLIPAIASIGYLLPQLLIANYAEGLRRKKPFLLIISGIGERGPYLMIGLLVLTSGLARRPSR